MIVCEGSVIRPYDSEQLWYMLEVTPHGIIALGGTVQEFDLLRHFETDGAQWTQSNIGDWQIGRRLLSVVCIEHSCGASINSSQNIYACIARCDLRFGLRSFSEASGIQCGTRFST